MTNPRVFNSPGFLDGAWSSFSKCTFKPTYIGKNNSLKTNWSYTTPPTTTWNIFRSLPIALETRSTPPLPMPPQLPNGSWSLQAQQTGDAPRRYQGACTFNSFLVSENIPLSTRASQILKWKNTSSLYPPLSLISLTLSCQPRHFITWLPTHLLSHLSLSLAQKHVHFLRARTCPPRYLMYPNACSNAQVTVCTK